MKCVGPWLTGPVENAEAWGMRGCKNEARMMQWRDAEYVDHTIPFRQRVRLPIQVAFPVCPHCRVPNMVFAPL